MKTRTLTEALERVETWPADVQDELAEFVLELDAGLKDSEYQPAAEELAGVDRGLRAAAEGRFATEEEVEAAFAKFRVGTSEIDALAEEALAAHRAGRSREL